MKIAEIRCERPKGGRSPPSTRLQRVIRLSFTIVSRLIASLSKRRGCKPQILTVIHRETIPIFHKCWRSSTTRMFLTLGFLFSFLWIVNNLLVWVKNRR